MNAASISRPDLVGVEGENAGDSDSDTSSYEAPDYYQPISSSDGDGDSDSNEQNFDGYHAVDPHSNLSNGHDYRVAAENGMRSLNLSENQERDNYEEEEEEEERRRAESESAMRIALEEAERRRNAPLTAENATRVMERMRGVSFTGSPPDWTSHFPEDRWLDQLRCLSQQPHSTA